MKKKPYVGDKGSELLLQTGIDLTGLTVQIRYFKPVSQLSNVWPATVYRGTKVYYKFQPGDLDEAGVWRFQALVENSDGTFGVHGDTVKLEVFELGE